MTKCETVGRNLTEIFPRDSGCSPTKNRDGSNFDRLEILLGVLSPPRPPTSLRRRRSVRWQSHDNQRRIVIGNPISLPNCTPNRFARDQWEFSSRTARARARATYLHVSPRFNTRTPEIAPVRQLYSGVPPVRFAQVQTLIRIEVAYARIPRITLNATV